MKPFCSDVAEALYLKAWPENVKKKQKNRIPLKHDWQRKVCKLILTNFLPHCDRPILGAHKFRTYQGSYVILVRPVGQ